jgi:hypothetical protein
LCCALCCPSAQAQTPAIDTVGVELSIPNCEDILGTQITSLVELELAPRRATPPANPKGVFTRASLRCVAAHATITVEDPRRPSPLVLELELAQTPREARPRFLALAVAELIATSRLEHISASPTPQPPPPQSPRPQAAQPSQSSQSSQLAEPSQLEHRFTLFIAAGATRALQPALFAPAVTAGVSRAFSPFALIGDVAYERGQMHTTAAVATAQSLSVALAPAWQVTTQHLTLSLGLGLRAGYAQLAGSPRQPGLMGRTLSGFFLTPISDTSLQVHLTHRWSARLALELGYVVKPVRGLDADQGALLALRGGRVGATLGVAWLL